MTGLSNANFMSGLMQGYGFADRMASNRQARGLRDAQELRQQEIHKQRSDINAQTLESNELAIKQKKQNILTNDALREARIIAEKGGSPLSVLKQDKYAPLGMGIIGDSASRQQTIKDGQVIQSSFENRRFEPAIVDTMERHLAPKFKALQEKDGLKRRLTGIVREGENQFSLEYVVTKPDGSQYVKEHTVNNSSDPNDPMRVFTLQDFAKIGGTISQRAAVASELEKYAGNPQRELEALEFMLTGKKPAKPKYTVQKGYGEHGREQLIRIGPDGKQAGYVGGEKARTMSDAEYKAGVTRKDVFKAQKEYRDGLNKLDKWARENNIDRNSKQFLDAVAQQGRNFVLTLGYNPDTYDMVQSEKIKHGDYSPPTHAELVKGNQAIKAEIARKNAAEKARAAAEAQRKQDALANVSEPARPTVADEDKELLAEKTELERQLEDPNTPPAVVSRASERLNEIEQELASNSQGQSRRKQQLARQRFHEEHGDAYQYQTKLLAEQLAKATDDKTRKQLVLAMAELAKKHNKPEDKTAGIFIN